LGTPEFVTAINNSDPKGILFGIGKAFNGVNKEAQDFIINLLGGRREAATLIPALANPQQLDELIKTAENSGGSLEERFGKVKETLSNTFQRLNEEIRKFFVTILESGIQDLIKDILGLLGAITKGVGGVLGAISPVLAAFDGLPIKILAIIGAIKAVNSALGKGDKGGGGGGSGLSGLLGGFGDQILDAFKAIPEAIQPRITKGQAAIGRLPEKKLESAQALFSALAAGPAGMGADITGQPLPSQNRRRTMGETYKNERYGAGVSRTKALGKSISSGFETAKEFTKAAAEGVGADLVEAAGGPLAIAVEGIAIAYTFIQDGVEKQKAALKNLEEYANDTNTSIEELRIQSEKLARENAGISLGSQLAGVITGEKFLSEKDYASQLLKNREYLNDTEKQVIDILVSQRTAVQAFVGDLANQGNDFSNVIDDQNISTQGLGNELKDTAIGLIPGSISAFFAGPLGFAKGIGGGYETFGSGPGRALRKAADASRIKTGKDIGKFNVSDYASAVQQEIKGQSEKSAYNQSGIADALGNGDAVAQAVDQRVKSIAGALGANLDQLDSQVALALGEANPIAALESITTDATGDYSDQQKEQARTLLKDLEKKAEVDPELAKLLNSQGIVSSAAVESLMKFDDLVKKYQMGSIGGGTYLQTLEKQKRETLRLIEESSGLEKGQLYEIYLTQQNAINDFLGQQAQRSLDGLLKIIDLTQDPGTVDATRKKLTATQRAIGSFAPKTEKTENYSVLGFDSGIPKPSLGPSNRTFVDSNLTKDDLTNAAYESIQTQQELAMQLIRNADSAEEAAKIASQPIEIPLETRQAAIKGTIQTMVSEWSTFSRRWKNFFANSYGDTIDMFMNTLTEGVANGTITAEDAQKQLGDRIATLEAAKKKYMADTGAGPDDAVAAAYQATIDDIKAIQDYVKQYGTLPGDPGGQITVPIALEQADRSRREAAAGVVKANANKDSVKIAQTDLATAEENLQKGKAAGITGEELSNLEAAVINARNNLTDAYKNVADSVRGIAKAQAAADKDNVRSAQLDLEQAQADYAAAAASGDEAGKNAAIAAEISANAAIRDAILNKKRIFANLMKALGSQDSLDQAQYDVDIARMNLDNAVGDEEKWQAWIDLIAAERAQREAFKRRRQALADLEKAKTQDPVKQAQIDLNMAQQMISEAQTMDEQIDAQKALIDAQRAMTDAMNAVRDSQFNLRRAELEAIGDDIGAAQVSAALAKKQLQDAIAANKGQAEINNLKAGVIGAEKAVRDAVFQGRMDDYKFLLDMGEITQSQYADYLETLKMTLIPGTKQFKDLEVTIKQLRDDIGGNLQANLPTSLQLPTLYEVRRLNQMGQNNASGQSIGYQDNKNVQVTVYVNNGMSQGQVVDTLAKAMNVGTAGLESKRY
jgi:hypothetical protein